MFLVIDLKNNSNSLTQWKLFGTYFHSISRHATDQYKLFSGTSTNTEKEEAFFTGIKTNTKLITNCQPENLIIKGRRQNCCQSGRSCGIEIIY